MIAGHKSHYVHPHFDPNTFTHLFAYMGPLFISPVSKTHYYVCPLETSFVPALLDTD